MPLFFIYLFKLSITIAVVYIFYQLVLRRLTFYSWNRLYLLIYTVLAFFIPLINISPAIENENVLPQGIIEFIPPINNFTTQPQSISPNVVTSEFETWELIQFLLISGLVFFLIKLMLHFYSLVRLKIKSKMITEGRVTIYQVDKNIIPFSFGDSIFINQHLHDEKELKDIIRHEFIHVKQKHTIDIIWIELFCAFNWYNPFAWLIRKSIRQNLEFIADANVLEGGIDRKDYQYLLLKVMGSAQYRIASQFNFSSLKKRIAMMNRIKSAKFHLVKFLFILPLLSVLLLAFRDKLSNDNEVIVRYVAMVIDKDTKEPIKGVTITDQRTGKKTTSDKNGYYSFNLPADKKFDVHLKFQKSGYSSYTNSSFSLLRDHNSFSFALIAIDELKKGNPSTECIDCSTSETVGNLKSGLPGYNEVKQYYSNYLETVKTGKYFPLNKGVKGFEAAETDFPNSNVNITGTIKLNKTNQPDINAYLEKTTVSNNDRLTSVEFYGENIKVIAIDTVPDQPEDYKTFLVRNPSVKRLFWMSNPHRIGIQIKDGKTEIYHLDKSEEITVAESKYGKLPEPPPPPPSKSDIPNISNIDIKVDMPEVVMYIETDALNIYPGNRLKFSGNVLIQSNETKVSSDMVDMRIDDIRIITLDNKEISSPAAYLSNERKSYELTILKKDKAMEKYGAKGINGALVLVTL